MSEFFSSAKTGLLLGNFDLVNDEIAVLLLDSDAAVDTGSDQTLEDLNPEHIIAERALTGAAVIGGVYVADATTFNVGATAAGRTVGALVLFRSTETRADSMLLAYIDDAPELPLLLDGSDVVVVWASLPDGILRLE